MAAAGDGWWSARSRDVLMDSPIEFSNHKVREWTADGRKFRLAMHGRISEVTANDFARMTEAVTLEGEGVFGDFPEFETGTYTFLIDYMLQAATDGMEHRDSSVISQSVVPEPRRYPDLMNAVAHEFFHAWNVERIRPKSLEPFDLERANMSSELWFAEGITNYYGDLLLERAGILSLDRFGAEIANALNAVIGSGKAGPVNAREMSRLAPLFDRSFIAEPTNLPNTFVSYYHAGQALGLGLDLMIRTRYPGKSLDDWMRALWQAHRDVDRPYAQDDLERTLTAVTGDAAFTREVFERYLTNVNEIDYEGLLRQSGLLLRPASPGRAWAGVTWFAFSEMGMAITAPLMRGTPGYAAGLDRGDVVIRADGTQLKALGDWMRVAQSRKPGDHSQLRVRSSIGERIVDLVWRESPTLEIVPFEKAKEPVTPQMKALREEWLGSKALSPKVSLVTPATP
jgi:predicted metalloprotease with PDZ domain